MKTFRALLLGIAFSLLFLSCAVLSGALLSGCSFFQNHVQGGSASITGNPTTGDISGTVEIEFKDQQGNTIKRRYPRNHPAVQHLLANP